LSIRLLLRSSSLRISLLYGVLFIAAVMIVLLFIYFTTVGYLDRQTDSDLNADMRGLMGQFEAEGRQGLVQNIAQRVRQNPDGEVVYLLTDSEWQPLSGNLDQWPTSPIDEQGWTDFLLYEWDFEKETRHARALTTSLPEGYYLLVGRDVAERDHVQHLILDALLWALAITVVIAFGVGLLVSSRVTRRLENMNRTARGIMEGDLSRRVPTDGSGDDFEQVGINFNRMLDRIQALMTTVQQISNNVAHDLRKPLTHLQHRLEEARDSDPDRAREALEKASHEADELISTFNALLRIARVEARGRRSEFTEVDLGVLLEDVGELYEPTASEKSQIFEVFTEKGMFVQADRDLLFQGIANLVDNAIKYTPAGGTIRLSSESSSSTILVTVSDTGPGIPTELREKVFQRFFRVDDSRTTPGNGLGLSLVHAIADLHKADIRLADNSPGLKVELSLERHADH